MIEYKINSSFICDKYRHICDGHCHEHLRDILNGSCKEGTKEYEENKDLVGRKQIIRCLGPYCEEPCQYQLEKFTPYWHDDGLDTLINLIKWMGQKLNNCIENFEVDLFNDMMDNNKEL